MNGLRNYHWEGHEDGGKAISLRPENYLSGRESVEARCRIGVSKADIELRDCTTVNNERRVENWEGVIRMPGGQVRSREDKEPGRKKARGRNKAGVMQAKWQRLWGQQTIFLL